VESTSKNKLPPLRFFVIPAATILLLWSVQHPLRPSPSSAQPASQADAAAAEDALADLNHAFRQRYAATRKELVTRSGPIILLSGDDLTLLRSGKRSQAKAVPRLYRDLKVVSHVPLAIYVMLVPCGTGALSDEAVASLQRYRDQLVKTETPLASRDWPRGLWKRQQDILTASREFLDEILDRKQVTASALTAFTRKVAPLVLANSSDAASGELDCLDKQIRRWKAELSPEEWKNLHVIVMGAALPRRGNLAVQYFARLLKQTGEGERIIYAESIYDEGRALDLLGTHLLDRRIGSAFFNDCQRMLRDLLADAAQEHLQKMTFDP
jgi:hypothetical protein